MYNLLGFPHKKLWSYTRWVLFTVKYIVNCDARISKELMTSLGNYSDSGKYRNIAITNSKRVHVGPSFQFNAPVNIIKNVLSINNCENSESDANDVRLNENKYNDTVHIISRRSWLAQPPLEPHTLLEAPAKYVIICHTATEEGFCVSENTYVIRLIQDFHIEGRKWNDIGYNFLVGSDGKIYEGRGFNVVGAHTYRYNTDSFAIAFVGTFVNKLPPSKAIIEARKLIALGVNNGAIAENYSLVGHCQLSPTRSPGDMLYEEIKKWDNWDSSKQYFKNGR
ncbi:peptidoglycan-recognition protein SB2-like isoform X2 [Agrilus planipennis]|uniref:Peptidoglycan-recognition protein SB2-like isoform X2 n=1 Tax=Agrilus planipennis TaxID=224129 RepID=A0A1W4WFG2_AGRPL|nr:peptidoglycan-recognition protein SB2-like isoform X2 [Agrilus planipennis]